MLNDVLPTSVSSVISRRLDVSRVYELRLRANKPVAINYDGKYRLLTPTGLSDEIGAAITCSAKEIEETVMRASKFSLYAENDRLVGGFLTVDGGIRVGVCGEAVTSGGGVVTVKNYDALCVRIPHEIKGAGELAFAYATEGGGVLSTLIVAPPGAGKTTVLRDFCRLLSERTRLNALLVDERNEIAAAGCCGGGLDVGAFTDVCSGGDKSYAFSCGIRSMRPDVILTDELSDDDCEAVRHAVSGGVRVIATAHADGVNSLRRRRAVNALMRDKIFERYVVLSSANRGYGYEAIYDDELNVLWRRDGS